MRWSNGPNQSWKQARQFWPRASHEEGRGLNFLTELKEGLIISWSAIRANKLRSTLTTLGIVIGIVTVTLMGTAIEGLNRAFLKSISFIGGDVLYVDRGAWFNNSYQEWLNS